MVWSRGKQKNGPGSARTGACVPGRRSAFTLVDVLVTIAVIAVLMSVMLPSLGRIRETTRRTVCASNIRQLGIGIGLYASDHRDLLVPSVFMSDRGVNNPQRTMQIRLGVRTWDWDGLGILAHRDYVSTPEVYYCRSHSGAHPFSVYAPSWNMPRAVIFSNYQYRAMGPSPRYARMLAEVPGDAALISDGMRTQADFNHRTGCNVMHADLSVAWWNDNGGRLLETLPPNDSNGDNAVNSAWHRLDGDGTRSRSQQGHSGTN